MVESGIRVAPAAAGVWLAPIFSPGGRAAAASATNAAGYLAGRKQDRVARTLTKVVEEVERRTKAGDEVRGDIANDDSDDAVLFESVVDAAAQGIEEKKCEVIANVYAAIAFESTIPIVDAFLYIRESGKLHGANWSSSSTYSTRTAARSGPPSHDEGDEERNVTESRRRPAAFLAELAELRATLELVGDGIPGGQVHIPQNVSAALK